MSGDREGRFRVETTGKLQVCNPVDLRLYYRTDERGFRAGGNLWIFYDIRQYLEREAFPIEGGIEVSGPLETEWESRILSQRQVVRTFDIHPEAPEFLHGLHIQCIRGAVPAGESITIRLRSHPGGFLLPQNAIDAFRFWLVEDPHGEMQFHHPGGKYFFFLPRETDRSLLISNPISIAPGPASGIRVISPSIAAAQVTAQATALDAYGNPVPFPGPQIAFATDAGRETVRADASPTVRASLAVQAPCETVRVTCGDLSADGNPIRTCDTPPEFTLYWGDPHCMLFNQRPVVDHFAWAKEVAHLDFSGGQYFSYSACIREVWEELQDAWRCYDLPGAFVSLPSVEFDTPPDASHRVGFFPKSDGFAPIFCEERAAAYDPKLHARFHSDTVLCRDHRELYRAVHALGGFVQGHFHTNFYEGEHIAEIYQKQRFDGEAEEARINRALQQGVRLSIVGGSDTHDSRPANPYPEPGPVRPSGLTGVWAERLDRPALFDAVFQRRCYATTGVRILVDFRVNGCWMGDIVRASRFEFTAEVLGTAEVDRIELVVMGAVAGTYEPRKQHVTLADSVPLPDAPSDVRYCYLRIAQRDGHRAWSSPIWLEVEAS